jgi:hypothetical protein
MADGFRALHSAVRDERRTGELIVGLVEVVRRYVALPSDVAALAVALWVLHTWALDGAHCTPYLVVQSPAKRSGKTRLLEVLELLVRSPWRVIGASESAMFRKIEQDRPTLLLDEVDAIFGSDTERNEPLRAVLNGGNRPGAAVARSVGQGAKMTQRDFSVYCPKLLAGIASHRWPDTVLDRAIRVTLQRKRRRDELVRFRYRDAHAATEDLRAALAAWAEAATGDLQDARPDWPAQLNDRACESWEPLFAIADLADLGAQARAAALALMVGDDDSEAYGLRLLGALRHVFADEHALATRDILAELNGDDELPFGGWNDGKGLDARGLGRLLRPFDIKPRVIRIGESTPRGYLHEQFIDAWERYVDTSESAAPPAEGDLSATSATSQAQSQKSVIFHPQHDPHVADRKSGEIPPWERDVADVADKKPPDGGNGFRPHTEAEYVREFKRRQAAEQARQERRP